MGRIKTLLINFNQHEREMGLEKIPESIEPPSEGIDEGSQQQDDTEDSYVVDWDGPSDPANPMNWPPKLKWTNCIIVSFFTFITYGISSLC
jgi:hypothetical protein